jgi:hypothetical protein
MYYGMPMVMPGYPVPYGTEQMAPYGTEQIAAAPLEAANNADLGPAKAGLTICFRNIPNNYTAAMVIDLLDSYGFRGFYDFVYVPHDFKRLPSLVNTGYFFVNFASPDAAACAWRTFDNFQAWSVKSNKVLAATWAKETQGLKACISRYRNSPVMHKKIPLDCKPLVFENGRLVPLRSSKKRVKEPRFKVIAPESAQVSDIGSTVCGEDDSVLGSTACSESMGDDSPDYDDDEWDALNAEVQKERERHRDVGRPTPIVDAGAAACHVCTLTFTQLRRRHNCQGCGQMCCALCAPLANERGARRQRCEPFKLKRLCLSCVDKGLPPGLQTVYETRNTFIVEKAAQDSEDEEGEPDPVSFPM